MGSGATKGTIASGSPWKAVRSCCMAARLGARKPGRTPVLDVAGAAGQRLIGDHLTRLSIDPLSGTSPPLQQDSRFQPGEPAGRRDWQSGA
jgi:hypothetical protein